MSGSGENPLPGSLIWWDEWGEGRVGERWMGEGEGERKQALSCLFLQGH